MRGGETAAIKVSGCFQSVNRCGALGAVDGGWEGKKKYERGRESESELNLPSARWYVYRRAGDTPVFPLLSLYYVSVAEPYTQRMCRIRS